MDSEYDFHGVGSECHDHRDVETMTGWWTDSTPFFKKVPRGTPPLRGKRLRLTKVERGGTPSPPIL